MKKKERILQTALKLFIDKGFDRTPTSLISKKARVATGTLFHHFKNKEALINTLYLDIKIDLVDEMSEGFKKFDGLKETLYCVWYTHLSWVMKNEDKFQFLIQYGESPHITQRTKQRVEDAFQYVFETIKKGKKDGVFYDISLDLMMVISSAHIMATSRYFIENPGEFKNQLTINETFDSFWHTLAKVK